MRGSDVESVSTAQTSYDVRGSKVFGDVAFGHGGAEVAAGGRASMGFEAGSSGVILVVTDSVFGIYV